MAASFTLTVVLNTTPTATPINGVQIDLFDLTTSPPTLVGTLLTRGTGAGAGLIDSSKPSCWLTGQAPPLVPNNRYRLSFDGGTPGASSTITVVDPTQNPVVVGQLGTTLVLQGPQHIEFRLTSGQAALDLGQVVYVVGPAFTLSVVLGTVPINGVKVDLFDLTTSPPTQVGTLQTGGAGVRNGLIDSSNPSCWPPGALQAGSSLLSNNTPYKLSFDGGTPGGSSTITVGDPTLNPVVVGTPTQSPTPPAANLLLQGPQDIYFTTPSSAGPIVALGSISYEIVGYLLSGTVQRQLASPANAQGPLANVGIDMVDPSGTVLDHATSDAQGNFGFSGGPQKSQLVTLRFPSSFTDKGDNLTLTPNEFSYYIIVDVQNQVGTTQVYQLAQATVTGLVTNGTLGIQGISVELFYPKAGQSYASPSTTDQMGYFLFSNVTAGPVELRFPGATQGTVQGGTQQTWELQAGQSGTQSFTVVGGQVHQAQVVVYQPEPHAIVWTVTTTDGKPAPGKLVEVQTSPATTPPTVVAAGVTGADGTVTLNLDASGTYTVVVYPYPGMTGQPIRSTVSVSSVAYGSTTVPPAVPGEGGGGGGGAGGNGEAVPDLQSYPVLTEEVPAGVVPTTTRPATPGTVGGVSALAQTADKAIREVLSWRTKSNDPQGFVQALGQAFDLKEVEGHTEWTWTPRSYTVQTDMGVVTGAQASIYARAKVALDQSLPLLSGLYPLVPNVEPEDLRTVQAVVSTQFTALVNELGVVGGPRVPRVDELFRLLLGHEDPLAPPTRPEEIVGGSLGLVRKRFGFDRKYVTTVDDEQNLTNYYILVDYVIGLKDSWIHEKPYFIRNGFQPGFSPFFGTQLVLLSRSLDMVAQAVQDAYFAMDSVFMGDAERQISQLNFAGLTLDRVPDPKGGVESPYTFPPDTSGLFVAELLDWVDRSASDELPRLLQDAGKDGIESLRSYTDRLRRFVHAAIPPTPAAKGLPHGYHTPRVKRAMQLLADGLDETYKLALQLTLPDQPQAVTPDELRRLVREEISRAGQPSTPSQPGLTPATPSRPRSTVWP
jgi:hypothetical protein